MIGKNTQIGMQESMEVELGTTGGIKDADTVCGSKLLLDIQGSPFLEGPLGNESDDYRFLKSKKTGYGRIYKPKDDFVKAAERQKNRLAFKESGLRSHCWGRVIGYDNYMLSDKYESIRPGSLEDKHIFFIRVQVWQNKTCQLEFTQEFLGNFGIKVRAYLRDRWGITQTGEFIPIVFSHGKGKWTADLSKRPLAINSPNAKPPLH